MSTRLHTQRPWARELEDILSAAMLALFGRLRFGDPWSLWLSHTIVRGLPAAIGGAAGRLAV